MFRKRSAKEETPPEVKPEQEAPKMWGRRVVRPAERAPEPQPDSAVPPPPR